VKKPLVSLALAALILSWDSRLSEIFLLFQFQHSRQHYSPDVMVTANVEGRVVDQDGTPVAGRDDNKRYSHYYHGCKRGLLLQNIPLSSRFGYIKAAKSGYFTGSRSIATTGGESSFVTIQLLSRSETGNFLASSGGKIMVNPGDT